MSCFKVVLCKLFYDNLICLRSNFYVQMTSRFQGSSEIDAIFSHSGCDPFYASASPKSHYIPSSLHPPSDELKHSVLTPEKIEKIPVKDHSSYVPLSYSFCEEEIVESKDSSQEPLKFSLDISNPDEDNSAEIKSTGSSVIDSDSVAFAEDIKESSKETTAAKTETIFLREEEIEPQTFMKPKISSTQRSTSSINISHMMNRFRHGKPLSPSERKSQNLSSQSGSNYSSVKSRPPSGGGKQQFDWLNSDVMSNSSRLTDKVEDEPSHNTSVDELQQRVEKILKESTSSLHSQLSSDSSVWSSSSLQKPAPVTNVSTSRSLSSVVSSDSVSKTSLSMTAAAQDKSKIQDLKTDRPKSKSPIVSLVQIEASEKSDLKDDFSHFSTSTSFISPLANPPSGFYREPKPQHKDVVPCPPAMQSSPPVPVSLQDDILQQWRLRRKMEAARTAADDPLAKNYFKLGHTLPQYDFTGDELRFTPAEKPLDVRQQTNKKSVGVSAVPMVTSQTQTSPTSSLVDFHIPTSSRSLSDHVEKNDHITMHRVTVVAHDASRSTPPPSVSSQPSSVDSWSDAKTSADSVAKETQTSHPAAVKARKKTRKNKSSPSKSVASPTTTMVKKVVGARLFDVSSDTLPASESTRQKSLSNETFDSSRNEESISEKSVCREFKEVSISESNTSSKNVSTSVKDATELPDDPDLILKDLLDRIEHDTNDFKDDPVLISLREQRLKYTSELLEIDKKLKILQAKDDDENAGDQRLKSG